ncbi:hypothetical protein NUBL17187_07600 [Klebsiella michiganensis]|nr:hypothetical protein NUBL17187_07600 [Klebsiella michiganensis]
MRSIASGKFPPLCARPPGAALDAPCPGYGFTAVCQTVARTDAQHRLRECPLPDANRRRPVTLIL